MIGLKTPTGKTVEVDDLALDAVVTIIEGARSKAFDEVLELLDHDYERTKECGDLTTAAALEVIRAKVRAKKEAK